MILIVISIVVGIIAGVRYYPKTWKNAKADPTNDRKSCKQIIGDPEE